MATYKQTDIVTESKQRGGKRDNAGRKSKHGEPTAIIRLPVSVIEKIKQGSFETVTNSNSDKLIELEAKSLNCFQCVHWLDDRCSKGLTLSGWTCDSFESWQAEINRLKHANIALVEQRDREHSKVISLESELRTLKIEPAKLKQELSAAKRELSKQQTRFCQCLTASGHQCQKTATHENKHGGFYLWTCEQHYQSVINASSSEPEQQHQGETSEPLNLTPDKVFKYSVYGNDRLIAWFNDDWRIFSKDFMKRWEKMPFADKSHFTEKDGRFYFGKTEIFPVDNHRVKLPKSLINS